MARLALRLLIFALSLPGILAVTSCGSKHTLTGITVTPGTFTVDTPQPGATLATFTATGHFIHPPGDRDITNQVVWSASFPAIFTIDAKTGVATYVGGCGSNLPVTATASTDLHLPPSGNIVQGTALVNITQTNVCP